MFEVSSAKCNCQNSSSQRKIIFILFKVLNWPKKRFKRDFKLNWILWRNSNCLFCNNPRESCILKLKEFSWWGKLKGLILIDWNQSTCFKCFAVKWTRTIITICDFFAWLEIVKDSKGIFFYWILTLNDFHPNIISDYYSTGSGNKKMPLMNLIFSDISRLLLKYIIRC